MSINITYCQVKVGFGSTNWGETDNGNIIDAMGIGDFTLNGDQPKAGLDVHMPYLFNGGLVNPGEAFHTYADNSNEHAWRMWSYPDKEQFNITIPPYSDSVNLKVVQEGPMNFYTNNTKWMTLTENGYLGISHSFPASSPFVPKRQLHIHGDGQSDGQCVPVS